MASTGVAAFRIPPPKGPQGWQASGACRNEDATLFDELPSRRAPLREFERVARARSICSGCPVLDECLESAVENRISGVQGGEHLRLGVITTAAELARGTRKALMRRAT